MENFYGVSRRIDDIEDYECETADELSGSETKYSAADALLHSRRTLGRIDIAYIAQLMKEDESAAVTALRGRIYRDPVSLEWMTADTYLSGNLARKLEEAEEAEEKEPGRYSENVELLRKALPNIKRATDIYVSIGSPFVPTDIIQDFINYIVNERPKVIPRSQQISHDEVTGIWEIPDKNRFRWNSKYRITIYSKFGTYEKPFLHLLEDTLNQKPIVIKDEKDDPKNVKKRVYVVNRAKTLEAIEKQKALISEFRDWIFRSNERKSRIRKIYENRYAYRRQWYDGSYLDFPAMNPAYTLHPYQKNAVARIILSPNTLLAHDVGSGKTLVMIAAGMEMRRIGLSKKNMYVVPNPLIEQWRNTFLELYPQASLLVIDPKHFTPAKREAILWEACEGDYDGILISYSCFDRITLSDSYYDRDYADKREELKNSNASIAVTNRKERSLETARRKRTEALQKRSGEITFDMMGVNTLFVDEAHNYKNLEIDTNVGGELSRGGSRKCANMLDKVRCVQKENGGRGVVFATGTPITNSLAELYIMQYYLQPGELALMKLNSFDNWLGMFAEREDTVEVDVDTSQLRHMSRFTRFHNLDVLTNLLSSIADFHRVGNAENGIPKLDGYTDVTSVPTKAFQRYLGDISKRADAVRTRRISRDEDNLLKIANDGRKAALDMRLVDEKAVFTKGLKADLCADNVSAVYRSSRAEHGTQLIFCDISTPKKGFNLYDEMKRLLVERGIPSEEIAFIHDVGDDEKRRERLFEEVREGVVRVLIGSTSLLGTGVNVQDRLIAIHHLTVPWRPSDMVQREGRILRQGNRNERVLIFRYLTEGSFDAYSWQILERKQRFIEQLLSGSVKESSSEDVSDVALSYAEIKALAIGNPKVKRYVELSNELTKTYTLYKKSIENHQLMLAELAALPAEIERVKLLVRNCNADIRDYEADCADIPALSADEAREVRERIGKMVRERVLWPVDTEVLTYRGFRVIVPKQVSVEHPRIELVRNGRYNVPLGAVDGILRRIDNALNGLPKRRDTFAETLKGYRRHEKALREELDKQNDYNEKIERLQREIDETGKEIGVNRNDG